MHPNHFSFDWMDLTSGGRNEIVFRNRNQSYGAYLIRRTYVRTLLTALLLAFTPLLLGLRLSLILVNSPESDKKSSAFEESFTFESLEPPVEVPPATAPPPAETPVKKETGFQFIASDIPDSRPLDEVIPQRTVLPDETGDDSGGRSAHTIVDDNKPDQHALPEIEKDDNTYVTVSEMPQYPGGEAALLKFIASHVQYPRIALEMGISGTAYVYFVVNSEGRVVDVSIKRGIRGGAELNSEAVRVISSMPTWLPGKHNGRPVRVSFVLPVTFVSK